VAPTELVDAENVRRSVWPNLGHREILERSRVWAKREGASLIVVFDGDPPEGETENVAGSGARSADDRIVELSLSTERPLWLVTSDRELRERVSPPPERVIGGGGFLRLLDRE
jgi:hypothetical protein